MKFVISSYGTRGDVEPCAAVGRELSLRGHDVCMAVAPDLVGFIEAAGLAAVAFGPDLQSFTQMAHRAWTTPGGLRVQFLALREVRDFYAQCWREIGRKLASLADGADLLLTGAHLEAPAANVADYYHIPLATVHHSPLRANGHPHPFLPPALTRSAMTARELLDWQITKKADQEQRRELSLPRDRGPSSRRMAERGSLEIQAYDEVAFPRLASEWARSNGNRQFVGALTLDSFNESDDGIASWIVGGAPPIFFGFGSTPVKSAAETVGTISAACTQIGERALICAVNNDFSEATHGDHVKIVGAVNYAAVFPACRALVHHGGAGTTAAGLRAGAPTLVLWTFFDQSIWGTQIYNLKVGTSRRFTDTTDETLVADLRQILAPATVARARQFASQMTQPEANVTRAADLVERFARSKSRR